MAERNLFSGDFVIPSLRSGQRLSAAKDLQPFSPNRFFNWKVPSLRSGQRFGAGHPKKSLTFWGPRIKPLRMTG